MSVSGLELRVIETYLRQTLSADAALVALLGDGADSPDGPGIFSEAIRDHVKYPYVIYNLMFEQDAMTAFGDSVMVVADYQIKGVERAETYSTLHVINQRIYQLLHKQGGTTPDGIVASGVRLRQLKYSSISETVQYRHLGGVYRFWAESPA